MPCNAIFWPYNWRVITADKTLEPFSLPLSLPLSRSLSFPASLGCKKAQRGVVINYVGYCVLSWLESSWVEPRVGQFLLEHDRLFRDTITTHKGSSNQWPRKTLVHHMTADPHSLTRHQVSQKKSCALILWISDGGVFSLVSDNTVLNYCGERSSPFVKLQSDLTSNSLSVDVGGADPESSATEPSFQKDEDPGKEYYVVRYFFAGSIVHT